MDISNIQRKNYKKGPKVNINIKVSEDVSKWLIEKNYSPTGIFNAALKELGCPELTDKPNFKLQSITEAKPKSLENQEKRARNPVYVCECGYVDTEDFLSCPKCEKIQKKEPKE